MYSFLFTIHSVICDWNESIDCNYLSNEEKKSSSFRHKLVKIYFETNISIICIHEVVAVSQAF